MMSKKERGMFHASFDEANEIVIVKWMDNSCVSMVSNCTGKFPLTSAERWSRTTKTPVQICILLILCFCINVCSNLLSVSDRSHAIYPTVQSKHKRNWPNGWKVSNSNQKSKMVLVQHDLVLRCGDMECLVAPPHFGIGHQSTWLSQIRGSAIAQKVRRTSSPRKTNGEYNEW